MQPKLDSLNLPSLFSQNGFCNLEFIKINTDYAYTIDDWINSIIWAVGGGDQSITNETSKNLEIELRRLVIENNVASELQVNFDHFLWTARK